MTISKVTFVSVFGNENMEILSQSENILNCKLNGSFYTFIKIEDSWFFSFDISKYTERPINGRKPAPLKITY